MVRSDDWRAHRLSLVYVTIENRMGHSLTHRWIVALMFGLAHGFGFAIALRETLQFARCTQ
jgi:hypothetical protein